MKLSLRSSGIVVECLYFCFDSLVSKPIRRYCEFPAGFFELISPGPPVATHHVHRITSRLGTFFSATCVAWRPLPGLGYDETLTSGTEVLTAKSLLELMYVDVRVSRLTIGQCF